MHGERMTGLRRAVVWTAVALAVLGATAANAGPVSAGTPVKGHINVGSGPL